MTAPTITAITPATVQAGVASTITITGTGMITATATCTVGGGLTVTTPGGTVSNKALTSNVATLTTSAAHGLLVGDVVNVAGVDATFNSTGVTVVAVPTTTTFTYALVHADVTSAAATGTVVSTSRITAVTTPDPSQWGRKMSVTVTNGDASGSATFAAGPFVQAPSVSAVLVGATTVPGGTTGSNGTPSGGTFLPIQSKMASKFSDDNAAFNALTEVRGQIPAGYSLVQPVAPTTMKAGAGTISNWGAEMNTRNQETNLKGENLGDAVAGTKPTTLAHPTS